MGSSKMRELESSELSGAFVVKDPDWRQKIFFGGLLLLLVHPIGWPVALGYRKTLISNLTSGTDPLLPTWKGNIFYFFIEGLKAMGVIFGYLSPLYLVLIYLLITNGVLPNISWLYVIFFFLACTIVSTLSFPAVLVYMTFFSTEYRIPWMISLAMFLLFVLIIFFIPACFLQVSKSGRYRSAFNIPAAYSTLRLHFYPYCRAWYHSAIMSLVGHFALPFAPWGIFWCYLSIIFEFNSILQQAEQQPLRPTWYQRMKDREALLLEPTSLGILYQCTNTSDNARCGMLKIGPVLVPLPLLVSNALFQKK